MAIPRIDGQNTAGLLVVATVVGYIAYHILYAATHTPAPAPDAWLTYYGPPTDQGVPGVPTTDPIMPVTCPTASTAGTSGLGGGQALKPRWYPATRDLIPGGSS